MAEALEFKTVEKLSPSDFGGTKAIVAKNSEGGFRSFGINYQGNLIWSNDENWYKAWINGSVIPGSITIKEEQRIRNVIDPATGQVVMENGRKKTEAVAGEKVWQLVTLKTKAQLENEDAILVWERTRQYSIKGKIIEERNKYLKAAQENVAASQLSPEQEAALDELFSGIEF